MTVVDGQVGSKRASLRNAEVHRPPSGSLGGLYCQCLLPGTWMLRPCVEARPGFARRCSRTNIWYYIGLSIDIHLFRLRADNRPTVFGHRDGQTCPYAGAASCGARASAYQGAPTKNSVLIDGPSW